MDFEAELDAFYVANYNETDREYWGVSDRWAEDNGDED
jgi:hypothetical protein